MESSSWPESLPSDRKRAIYELVKGRDFATKLKLFLNESSMGDEESVPAEDLLLKVLTSFTNSLSILNPFDSDEVSQFPASSFNLGSPSLDGRKSEDSGKSSKRSSTVKDRRGCYKRRKTWDTWTRDSPQLVDDGYAWRKYGQKVILNAKYPRNYFRCTHKHDQGCKANKHVQRIQEDPALYRSTYSGNHTCKSLLRTNNHLILSFPDANDSSKLISFDGSKRDHHHFSKTTLNNTTNIKQEYKDRNNNNQSSSSDYLLPPDDWSVYDHGDVVSYGVNINSSSSSCTTSTHSFEMDHLMVTSVKPSFDDDILQYSF